MAFEQFSNNQDEENQNKEPGTQSTNAGNQSAQIGMGSAAAPQANRQGSGRFTNMQKYVQANKQGAQNLAQRVGTGIQNQLSATEKDVNKATQDVSTNVGSGREKLTTAGQSENELAKIGEGFKSGQGFSILNNDRGAFGQAQQNLQGFTQNPNYQNFMNVKAGEGVNEQELAALQNKASQGASAFQDLFKQRQSQVGNVEGRKSALNEFIGGKGQAVRPAYSSGQSRLDQLVMGQNAPALQGLINKVGANQANVQTALGNVAKTGSDVSTLTADEQALINKITGTATGAQQAFEGAFNQDKINELNTERQRVYSEAVNQLKSGNIGSNLYDQLGLSQAEVTGLDPNDYFSGKAGVSLDDSLYGGLSTYGLLDKARDEQGLMDKYFQQRQMANQAQDIVSNTDVDTSKLFANLTGQPQKFQKAGDTQTALQIGKNEQGQSNLLTDVLARRNETMNMIDATDPMNRGNLIQDISRGQIGNAGNYQAIQDYYNRNRLKRV